MGSDVCWGPGVPLSPGDLPRGCSQNVPCLGCPHRGPDALQFTSFFNRQLGLTERGTDPQTTSPVPWQRPLACPRPGCMCPRQLASACSPCSSSPCGRTSSPALGRGPGLSPQVSRKPRRERPPSGGWPCGWDAVGCTCPRPAIGWPSLGHRHAGAVSAKWVLTPSCLHLDTPKPHLLQAAGYHTPRLQPVIGLACTWLTLFSIARGVRTAFTHNSESACMPRALEGDGVGPAPSAIS